MTLKFKLSTLDGLDDAVKAEYEKDGDGFKLKVSGIPGEADVKKLKDTLDKVRDERDAAATNLKKFKDVDPEKYAALLKEQGEREKKLKDTELDLARKEKDIESLETKLGEQHEKAITDLKASHSTELNAKTTELKTFQTESEKTVKGLNTALHTEMIEKRAMTALTDQGGDAFIMKSHVIGNLRIVETDGKHDVRVIDPKGTDAEPYRKDDKGAYLTESDVVTEMRGDDRFKNNFDGDKLPGGSGNFNNTDRSKGKASEVSGASRIEKGLKDQAAA